MISRHQINAISRTITDNFHPEKIVLFGSYAKGNPGKDSDLDILVIMPHEGTAAAKAAEIRCSLPDHIAIDLLVRTPAKIQQRLNMHDYFIMEALNGKVLYEAVHG